MPITIPRPGTRGVPFPRRIAALFSPLQRRGFRRRQGGRTQGGIPALMLETVGARSGKTRTAMLGYLEDGPGAWLVVASLAGSKQHPGWLYNLARDPIATVEFGDRRRRPRSRLDAVLGRCARIRPVPVRRPIAPSRSCG